MQLHKAIAGRGGEPISQRGRGGRVCSEGRLRRGCDSLQIIISLLISSSTFPCLLKTPITSLMEQNSKKTRSRGGKRRQDCSDRWTLQRTNDPVRIISHVLTTPREAFEIMTTLIILFSRHHSIFPPDGCKENENSAWILGGGNKNTLPNWGRGVNR